MTQPAYEFGSYEKDALTKPRDKAWENWAKFEKVGDKAQGFIRDVFFRASEGQFAEQRGITLEGPDGTLQNVGIKHIDFVLAKTDSLRLGDPLTVVFEKEIAPSVKGHSPTKQFAFYGKKLPENDGQKTVAQLEAEDRKIAVEEKAKADAEFDAAGKPETAAPAEEKKDGLPFEKPAAPATADVAAPADAPASTEASA